MQEQAAAALLPSPNIHHHHSTTTTRPRPTPKPKPAQQQPPMKPSPSSRTHSPINSQQQQQQQQPTSSEEEHTRSAKNHLSPNLSRNPSFRAPSSSDILPQLDLSLIINRTTLTSPTTPTTTEPLSRPSSRRFSQSNIDPILHHHQQPPPKLHSRASTPLFTIRNPDEKDRPQSAVSHLSTPSLFKRIKAGLTPKSSFASSPPLSTAIELFPDLTSSSSSNSIINPNQQLNINDGLPSRSSSDLQETVGYFDLSSERSQSDSMSPHQRQTMEELRATSAHKTNNTTTTTTKKKSANHPISRSFSQARIGSSPVNRSSDLLINRSLGPSSSFSREYNREAFIDPRLRSAPASSLPTTTTTTKTTANTQRDHHQQQQQTAATPKAKRLTRNSVSNPIQPIIELTKKNTKKEKEPGRPTTTSATTTATTAGKSKPLERNPKDESEEAYLSRLGTLFEKSKIPSILASSNDPFHLSALTKYMSSFEFSHDPIDLSLRKLLMVVDLPSETQQIDRVIESFSKRYTHCNPKLFSSPDQVYILAFSIIMLHTDAFNKSNKAKMSRADYVKNTRMDGIPNELLEYIYDNITYTPFVYVDPDRDISGQKITSQHQQTAEQHTSTSFFNLGGHSNHITPILQSSSILPGTKESKSKLDPYQLIAKGSTHELRPDLGAVIPSRNPFSFTGSVSWFDFKRLRDSFHPSKSVIIQVVNLSPTKIASIFKLIEAEELPSDPDGPSSSPLLGRNPTHDATSTLSPLEPKSPALVASPIPSSSSNPVINPTFLNLRAIKVGLVHLKIDTFTPFSTSTPPPLSSSSLSHSLSHNHHPIPVPPASNSGNSLNEISMAKNVISKKWKLFCVLLTARQLILIKDVGLAGELQESIKLARFRNEANPEDQLVVRITGLKPDLVLSLDGGIALLDSEYQRRPCTFRLVLTKDLSLLMGVDDHEDMNSWITHINYAAAYKTHRLPFWVTNRAESSPRASFTSRPTTATTMTKSNTHRIYQRAGLDGTPETINGLRRGANEDSAESLLSFSSSLRKNHQYSQGGEKNETKARGSVDDHPIISRTASFSNHHHHSLIAAAARPFDLGPSLIGESPRSSSVNSNRLSFLSSHNLPSHWDLVRAQIISLEGQILAAKTELNEDLRLARNLAVLTPFQLSTRSKLQLAIMPVANRVRNSRCQLSKLVCYREVLVRDLALGVALSNNGSGSTKINNTSEKTGILRRRTGGSKDDGQADDPGQLIISSSPASGKPLPAQEISIQSSDDRRLSLTITSGDRRSHPLSTLDTEDHQATSSPTTQHPESSADPAPGPPSGPSSNSISLPVITDDRPIEITSRRPPESPPPPPPDTTTTTTAAKAHDPSEDLTSSTATIILPPAVKNLTRNLLARSVVPSASRQSSSSASSEGASKSPVPVDLPQPSSPNTNLSQPPLLDDHHPQEEEKEEDVIDDNDDGDDDSDGGEGLASLRKVGRHIEPDPNHPHDLQQQQPSNTTTRIRNHEVLGRSTSKLTSQSDSFSSSSPSSSWSRSTTNTNTMMGRNRSGTSGSTKSMRDPQLQYLHASFIASHPHLVSGAASGHGGDKRSSTIPANVPFLSPSHNSKNNTASTPITPIASSSIASIGMNISSSTPIPLFSSTSSSSAAASSVPLKTLASLSGPSSSASASASAWRPSSFSRPSSILTHSIFDPPTSPVSVSAPSDPPPSSSNPTHTSSSSSASASTSTTTTTTTTTTTVRRTRNRSEQNTRMIPLHSSADRVAARARMLQKARALETSSRPTLLGQPSSLTSLDPPASLAPQHSSVLLRSSPIPQPSVAATAAAAAATTIAVDPSRHHHHPNGDGGGAERSRGSGSGAPSITSVASLRAVSKKLHKAWGLP